MLGSISATDGHACMLRAMCEVCKLLSSHTGAILRKKSSLIVWQFHVRLEQFWPKIITNCLTRWCLFAGKRSSFPLWRSAGGRSEPSSLCEPGSRWGGDRGGGWQLSGLYGRSGGGHGEAHLKGWLVITKLKPLSLFISLLLMLKKAFDNIKIEKWKVRVLFASSNS